MGLNEAYKRMHKPKMGDKTPYKQGYFIPKYHPEKCLTNGQNIYRSGLEYEFFDLCDRWPDILRYACEPISVKYLDPMANIEYCRKNHLDVSNPIYWKQRNYNIDMWVEMKSADGTVRKIFVEIKPQAQTVPPKPLPDNAKMKEIKRFNHDAATYLTNKAKWDAAIKFAHERGCEFQIWTEVLLKQIQKRIGMGK